MKKLLTFLLTALLAFGVGWAATYTMTLDQNANGYNNVHWLTATTTLTWQGIEWSASADANPASGSKSQVQIGTGSNPARNVNISTNGFTGTITSVTVNAWTAKDAQATLSMTVGGNSYISQSLTNTSTDYTGSGSSSGEIVINISQPTTSKALYIKSITVTYEEGATSSTDYSLVTGGSVNTWDDYVLVYSNGTNNYAFSKTTVGGLNSQTTYGFTLANDVVSVTSDAEINVLSLESAGNGLYYIKGYDGNYVGCGLPNSLVSTSEQNSSYSYIWQITVNSSGEATIYNAVNDRYLKYRSSVSGFKAYASSQSDAYNAKLYSHAGVAPTPELSVNPSSLDITSPYNSNGTGTFTVTGSNLTGDVSVTPSTGFTVDPTSISAANAANGVPVTVTYTGNSTTDVTGSVTLSSSGATDATVALTARKGRPDMPTFSVDGGDYTNGDEVQVTISAISGASIYYTLDGTDPVASRTLYSGPITINQTTTLKAIAVVNGISSEVKTAQFTFSAPPSLSTIYHKVTSTNDIEAGRKYIIVYEDGPTALKEIVSSGGNAENVTLSNNTVDINGKTVLELTMGGTASSATFSYVDNGTTYYLKSANKDLDASTSSSTWAVQGNSSDGYYLTAGDYILRYNSQAGSPFRCYSTTTGVIVYLYVQEESAEAAVAATDVNILDYDNATKSGTFDVRATNLTGGNITLTAPTNWSVNPNTIAYNASFPYSVTAAYTGSALGATGTINIAGATDNVSTTATANYTYAGSIYIVGDVNNLAWQTPTVGVQMTRNSSTGVYEAYVNAQGGGWYNGIQYAWLYFSKKVGSDYATYNDLGSLRFGPESSGNWGLQASLFDQPCALDQNGNVNTIYMLPGSYKITVTPADNTFSITPYLFDPTISVPSGTYTEAQTVTINCESELATLYYTLDGTDPTTSSATVANGGTLTISESSTLKVMAGYNYYGTPYTSNVVSATYTINSGGGSTTIYQKITSTDELTDGDYLIVNEAKSRAFDGSLVGSNLDATGNFFNVTISDNTIETDDDKYFTYDSSTGTLKSASGYFIGRTASSNGFEYDQSTEYENGITFDNNGNAIITGYSNGSPTTATLQYWISGTDGRFRYYTSTQSKIQLYKKVLTNTVATPKFNPSAGSYNAAQSVTISCETSGATIYYTTDGSTPTTSSNPYTEPISVTTTTTIKAIAVKDGMSNSVVATAVYEINSTLYTKVTSDDQIDNGKKYIIVYETTPQAFSGISGSGAASAYGTGTNVTWKTQGSVIDIANTSAQPFTLEGSKSFARLHFAGGYLESTSKTGSGIDFETSPYDDYEWQIEGDAGGYYLTFQYSSSYNTYTLRYNSNQFNLYSNATGTRAYLYVQSEIDAVDAPAITPPTGTYYENQTVSIDVPDGCTVYYTTNGSEPTTSSVPYTNEFTVAHTAGATTTIKAIAVDADNHMSPVTTAVYTWGTPSVVINPDSRNTTATSVSVTLTYAPNNANVYYTTDGSAPSATNGTLYQGEFTVNIPNVGDQVTVKAITIYGNSASPVATATYTHVAEELNIHEPFFTPIEGGHVNGSTTFNGEYYGDQTLQIGCTTPNADIYYEIVEEDGTTAPSASSVDDPTHSSIYYDGTTVLMTAGHSYRVKAIAYIGNYASTIAEGYYIIKPFTQTGNYFKNLKDFNDNCEAGVTAHFVNPVQVVYHSTYTNDGNMAEFCYVRDNSDYALVYFGKADQNNYHIFEMGDWLDGSQIAGTTSNSPYGYHIQVGTSGHTVTSWPSFTIGHNEILPEETTCKVIYEGRTDSINSWGHYVHLRYSTLSDVADESTNDPKHNGYITDHSNTQLNYYDKFYRWSAGTCSYGGDTYTIHHIGDYDQEFFDSKQNAGATFDVYGIVDYYSSKGFQICPIDFLWAFKPTLSVGTGTYTSEQTVTISVDNPDWALNNAVIYYKTDDMEDWAVYTGPLTINSDTHLQTYAEVEAIKKDATHTNYNDFVRSEIVEATYTFEGVEPPIISPESRVTEVSAGETIQPIPVTVETNPMSGTGTVTLYTTDGSDPRTSPTAIELNGQNGSLSVSENTTVSAVSYLTTGGNTIWSPVVTNTYEFIVDNDKEYNLLTSTPKVGSIYVIVNKADNVGLNKTQNATNRGATGVLFTDNTKTVVKGNDALEEFVLESASAGRYYFRVLNTQDYLCVTTNDNANLMTGGAEANAEATVSVNSGTTSGVDESYPASIAFSYDGTARYLRYYANGRTFTTYTSAINQDVFLYGIEVPNVLDPAIDPQSQVVQVTTGGEVVHVTVTPNSDNPNSAVTYYTTDGSDPRTSSTRIEWTSENAAFDVNVTTTIKAVTGIEFGDGMVWSNVVSDTYTFVGIKEPIISPEGGEFEFGTTVSVTVQTNPENTDNTIVTWYTTDDSDPRTSETRRELVGLEASVSFDVTENTTVTAVSSLVVEGQRVYSPVVSETYTFAQPISWPLHEIELSGEEGKGYTVQDNLIGAWYVRYTDSNNAVHPLLIAKDLNLANEKTYKNTDLGQTDYVKEVMGWQNGDWDQSNWVILDFKDILDPEDYEETSNFVGMVIQGGTVTGVYTDAQNYTMVLKGNAPTAVEDAEAAKYPGYTGPIDGSVDPATYSYAYNTYVPANFLNTNTNVGDNTGFVAPSGVPHAGERLFFMNPKVMEVVRVWAVYAGVDNGEDIFTVYSPDQHTVNGWGLEGAFGVRWNFNRLTASGEPIQYGRPDNLNSERENYAFFFHAVIARKPGIGIARMLKANPPAPQGDADDTPSMSEDYELYPLDFSSDDSNVTSVREVNCSKVIESVRYYNIMGMESEQPFEGINIVVTRFSDGSTSTFKVLK